jgi:hypothetical protein
MGVLFLFENISYEPVAKRERCRVTIVDVNAELGKNFVEEQKKQGLE